jgi:RNA polymerase sigma factor (sigma-70 family)
MNDIDLIRRFREGDKGAFAELRNQYRSRFLTRAFGWPQSIVPSQLLGRFRHDFESLFDDILMKTASAGGYDPALGEYQAYLRSSLKNAVCSYIGGKRGPRSETLETDLAPTNEEGGTMLDTWPVPQAPVGATAGLAKRLDCLRRALKQSDPAWVAEMKDLSDFVDKQITRLSPEDQDMLNRRFRDEQNYAEIAKAYGISEEDCRKNRLWRALKRLRGLLGGLPRNDE